MIRILCYGRACTETKPSFHVWVVKQIAKANIRTGNVKSDELTKVENMQGALLH